MKKVFLIMILVVSSTLFASCSFSTEPEPVDEIAKSECYKQLIKVSNMTDSAARNTINAINSIGIETRDVTAIEYDEGLDNLREDNTKGYHLTVGTNKLKMIMYVKEGQLWSLRYIDDYWKDGEVLHRFHKN